MISAIVAQAAKFAASRGGAAGGDQQVRQPAAASGARPNSVRVICLSHCHASRQAVRGHR